MLHAERSGEQDTLPQPFPKDNFYQGQVLNNYDTFV